MKFLTVLALLASFSLALPSERRVEALAGRNAEHASSSVQDHIERENVKKDEEYAYIFKPREVEIEKEKVKKDEEYAYIFKPRDVATEKGRAKKDEEYAYIFKGRDVEAVKEKAKKDEEYAYIF